MEATDKEAVRISATKHPRTNEKVIQYGTAGFRTKASDLDHVIYRMGLLAVLRSKFKQATIGVMITASHNPEEDNGVKLVDPMGEMLEMAWEKYATTLANVSDADLVSALENIARESNTDLKNKSNVVFARDTRPSSPALSQALLDGIKSLSSNFNDYGILTTPQLHYMVRCINTQGAYGDASEQGYYGKLVNAFKTIRGNKCTSGNYKPYVRVDCANGVGEPKMSEMAPLFGDSIKIDIVGGGGKLNYQSGADFVKVQQKAPPAITFERGVRYVSFDGDADRIVFYFQDDNGAFKLLDGDKIATLVAGYLKELVEQSGLNLNLGLVQTAYANGSSTKYISEKLKVPVACVPTGVKHLHHKALEYDIGVYFEANGHGTVIFSDAAMDKINSAASNPSLSASQQAAAQSLHQVIQLINQTVGDAISDLLLVETVLCSRGWSEHDWNAAYTDLPNRQLKVKVKDRTAITTTDAERRTVTPSGLQDAIDQIVAKFPSGRSFVRPSGTEDVVRVYAEAETQASADELGYLVSEVTYGMAGGVGEPPKPLQ